MTDTNLGEKYFKSWDNIFVQFNDSLLDIIHCRKNPYAAEETEDFRLHTFIKRKNEKKTFIVSL
jgi:hypothetical protein